MSDLLAHYVRIHLFGSATGIELFSRGDGLADARGSREVAFIRDELLDERQRQLAMAQRCGIQDLPLTRTVAKVGERLGRLKPNGDLIHRTPLTDLVDLEAMLTAVAGKIAGWQSLLTVVDQVSGLERPELEDLLAQAERQHETLTRLHGEAASRALVIRA